MSTRSVSLLLLTLLSTMSPATPATSFVYEGRLDDRGQPANGRYDLRLTPYPGAREGTTLAAPITVAAVEVREGRFRVEFDAKIASTDPLWLETAVRSTAEGGSFAAIPGRSKALSAALIGTCWSATGDSGSDPAIHFLGTTDAQPLVLRTRNNQSLRLEPSIELFGGVPITSSVVAGSSANGALPGVRGAVIAGGGVPAGNSDPEFTNEAPNRVTDHYGVVGGGYANRAGNDTGTLSDRPFATVAGGGRNVASGAISTVAGGVDNAASGTQSTIGGGSGNRASQNDSFIGGGRDNQASGLSASITGGFQNQASGASSHIGGGEANLASGGFSQVGGGSQNSATGLRSTVAGGRNNLATDENGTVGGGAANLADANGATIAGGLGNSASGNGASVAGGNSNTASATNSAVGGGSSNVANGQGGVVAGGNNNSASAFAAVVPGGQLNCAGGQFSLAAGRRAKIRPGSTTGAQQACSGVAASGDADGDEGSFVWADSQDADFVSTAPDQFMVRTSGGAVFTANSGTSGPTGNRLRVDGTLRVDTLGSAGSTTLCRNSTNQLASCSSSARYKDAIADLELGLGAVLRLRAVGYRWKTSGEADVGFVAEEVAAIDERLVTRNARGDIEGVKYDQLSALLANAVQELAARERLAAEELARLASEHAVLRATTAAQQARLDALEARLAGRVTR